MLEYISQPWPWYVAGPLIGLMVPMLLIFGNKLFGISSSLRHVCAAIAPANIPFLKYNWQAESWNLFFVAGIVLGGFVAAHWFPNPETVAIASETSSELQALGITEQSGLLPSQIFNWSSLFTLPGFFIIIVGGFLVGFGARYAGGCTSGHAIMGVSGLQRASFVAVAAFFAGGLFITHAVYPLLF